MDSSQQLQADILAATQNLKSLARVAPGSREGARLVEGRAKEEEKEEVKEEVEQGTQQVHPETQGRGVPAEKPEVEEELCTGVAGSAVAAGEGQGEPEESLSLAQEAPMGPPEAPVLAALSPPVSNSPQGCWPGWQSPGACKGLQSRLLLPVPSCPVLQQVECWSLGYPGSLTEVLQPRGHGSSQEVEEGLWPC